MRLALQRGAPLARPGEFTERAFLSGRIDLTQAEAVRDLIESQTLYQARIAAEQMGGALSRRIQPAKQTLVELISLLEAGIDFAEDDVEVTPDIEIVTRIDTISRTSKTSPAPSSMGVSFIPASRSPSSDGPTSAIVALQSPRRTRARHRHGHARNHRDLVTERVSLGGIPVELVDTAGLREATMRLSSSASANPAKRSPTPTWYWLSSKQEFRCARTKQI